MDLFSKWLHNANLSYVDLDFDYSLILETESVIRKCLTDSWLNECDKETSIGSPMSLRKFPISDLLQIAGDSQITELIELSEYLKVASESSEFTLIISNLKSKYHSTRFQFQIAYRLKKIGVDDLIFEPLLESGRRADLLIKVGGDKMLIECYRPEESVSYPYLEFNFLLKQGLEESETIKNPVTIALELKSLPTAKIRKEIIHSIKQFVKEKQNDVAFYNDFVENDDFKISIVTRDLPRNGEDYENELHPHFKISRQEAMRLIRSYANKKDLEKLKFNGIPETIPDSRVLLWLPPEYTGFPEDLRPTINTLAKKIKGKIPQTKSSGGEKRLIFVEHWAADKLDEADDLNPLNEELKKHSNLLGIILCTRFYDFENNRFRVKYKPILQNSLSTDELEFIRRLIEFEMRSFIPAKRVAN